MIPIRLELKNFLPYRVPDPLRFDGIALACLTGPIGTGESSVLDAITWALWGSARARRDDDLIHQGQTEMQVQFDFEQDSVLYRVIRKRIKRAKTGQTELTLLAWDPSAERWTLINEPSIRDTEKRISSILHLTYETFVHSAFLQQGRADSFTTQTPADRKRILSEILGLSEWMSYEEKVKDRLRKVESEIDFHQRTIAEITRELAARPGLLQDKTQAEGLLASAQQALKLAEERLDLVRGAPEALRTAQARRLDLQRSQRDAERDLAEAAGQITLWEKHVAECLLIIDEREDIEGGYEALQHAKDADRSLRDKLDALTDLDRRRSELNGQLAAARARLESEVTRLERSLDDLQVAIDADPAAELEALQGELEALRQTDARRLDMQRQEADMREEIATHKATLEALRIEGQEKKERRDTLDKTDSPTCPLCGQPLTAEHRIDMITQLDVELAEHRVTYANSRDRSRELEARLTTHRRDLDALDKALKTLPALQERAGKLQARADAAGQAAARREDDFQQLESLRAQLDSEEYGHDVRAALALLSDEADELGYDKGQHDAAKRTLDDYRRFETLKAKLDTALQQLPSYEKSRDGAIERRTRLESHWTELGDLMNQVEVEMAGLDVRAREYKEREDEVRLQHQSMLNARDRLSRAEQKLDSLDAQEERRGILADTLVALQHEAGILTELRTAFGKNGVPALIIEAAIPELEELANDLLRRMTDGRMALRLMTQRDKQAGGVIETLDIEIADELGTRNYEMYSGGEAFRINFALRIALSKLLARRAGAQLRTLFIDEGFGTQDEIGRAKLIDAINAIQGQFDLILVITHIDDLRDSFPVHIVIDKTSAGSRISVR
ncbi:MAG: SMC family ATPase [Chloroflexi bacterium]|nr:SMC family ATPase [Chloroflexota bacterium]